MVRHRIAGRKLSRDKDQRKALLRSLATELIIHEKIVTTEPKAKEARILVEKMITYGKGESLHHRRLALARLPNKKVIEKIFAELAAKYADRSGGYTRILKLGNRKGDAAPMAQVELV